MLDVNNVNLYQHLTNDRKDEEFENIWCPRRVKCRSKRTEEGKNVNSKQMCVSSQKHHMKKEDGATATASHLPSPWRNSAGWSRKGRTGRDSPRRFHFMGKTHKIPQMSYLWYETPAFSVIWLTLQNRWFKYIKQRCRMSLKSRLITQECKFNVK